MVWSKEKGLILVTFILVLLAIFFLLLVFIFIKRKNALIVEKFALKRKLEAEASEALLEIQEATLRSVSWELHDNIGQLMTLAKIQLQQLGGIGSNSDVFETLTLALNELRSLSKSINPEAMNKLNFLEATKIEIERLNKLNYIKASLAIEGKPFSLISKNEIILFRILQEVFSNTLKHLKATDLQVLLKYEEKILYIVVHDNGIGFDINSKKDGIGIKNISKRAELIGAELKIISMKNEGTTINIIYPKT